MTWATGSICCSILQGVGWVRESFHPGTQEDINTFETTIRVVGGLLAAWDLSGRT